MSLLPWRSLLGLSGGHTPLAPLKDGKLGWNKDVPNCGVGKQSHKH